MRWMKLMVMGLFALAATARATAAPPDAAAAIERHLAAGWEKAGVTPAPLADDAEFLRRVYLDLAGRVPTLTEARQFLDDQGADKRAKKIEALLNGPHYANHFTNVWRSLLLPEANTSLQGRFQLPAFQAWLHGHFAANTPYDQLVRELITAPLAVGDRAFAIGGDNEPSPAAFFTAKELMPENIAAATSRVFLGVRLECAQCHNHPFASWKRDEFWGVAAFFAGIKRQGPGDLVMASREDISKKEIAVPDTTRTVKARFLGGKEPTWKDGVAPRQVFADWVTAKDNALFARAAVNRMWSYFFGSGLIDPVDEMVGADSAVSYPELLDELSKGFVESGFDLKYLARSIVTSKPYQLSSKSAKPSQDDPRLFARMPLRGLTGEQLFDSLTRATGFRDGTAPPPGVIINGRGGNAREEFLSKFSRSGEKTTDHQTSILQALSLMNGRLTANATDLESSVALSAILTSPFFDDAGRIEAVYLAALSRRPTAKETTRMTAYVEEHLKGASDESAKSKRRHEALADVFWSLLNSAEFVLNH